MKPFEIEKKYKARKKRLKIHTTKKKSKPARRKILEHLDSLPATTYIYYQKYNSFLEFNLKISKLNFIIFCENNKRYVNIIVLLMVFYFIYILLFYIVIN